MKKRWILPALAVVSLSLLAGCEKKNPYGLSEPLPDVFSAYADKVYEVDQRGLAADLNLYLTPEEISEYVDAYMEEGNIDSSGAIKVFPIAKSTEIFAVNKTDWDKFAKATGETEVLQTTMPLKAKEDYEKVRALMGQGISRERAVANYVTDENFNSWYEDTKEQLEAIIGD